jgi:hypothetical protein
MNRQTFLACGLAGALGLSHRGWMQEHVRGADRRSLTRWEALIEQAQDPDFASENRGWLDRHLRRSIAEVDNALQGAPDDPGLHLAMVQLHQAGGDDLFVSARVSHHARRAAELAPIDATVLAQCGDALSFLGLITNDLGLWREGVSLVRRAYRIRPTRVHRHKMQVAVAPCPA